MKKVILIGLVIAAMSVSAASAQWGMNSVTINPFGTLFGRLLEANISVTPDLSIPFGGSFLSYDDGDDSFSFTKIGAGVRYYFKGEAIRGWYVGGLVDLYMVKAEQTALAVSGFSFVEVKGEATATSIGFGGLIGYQSIWGNGVTLDTGFGLQQLSSPDIDVDLKSSDGTISSSSSIDGLSIMIPIIQLSIGYAF